ncbi:MAG: molybdopterin molybdotransferase MoeA [Phycisphaeraceae bacterium]|nr:MAG: molybdopterin molybdotransferase MoeA [Phycisphaeraceae bacterium]
MGFQGRDFAFESPAAAVAGLIARVAGVHVGSPPSRRTEVVCLHAARGRILARPTAFDRDSPAFDYSAMDGYAVHASDVLDAAANARMRGLPAVTLAVMGESRIGAAPPSLRRNASAVAPHAVAIRIATGAALPMGDCDADAIIKREDVIEHADESGLASGGVRAVTLALETAERVARGDHIRSRGENARAGEVILAPGEVLTAASLGALAAMGGVAPQVFAPLRIAFITTGDELVAPDQTPGPFQIRNSNAAAITAILSSQAWIDVVHVSHINDDADLAAVLRDVTAPAIAAEAVLLTGGVSMGHRDPVRSAVESIGAEIVFHGLPQRPGKPMLGAVLHPPDRRAVPIIGLPGNPVSAMVTCTRIVLPVLAACAGAPRTPAALLPRFVHLVGDDGKRVALWWHRPSSLRTLEHCNAVAQLEDTRGSGDIISAARSDGFVELPPATGPSNSAMAETLVPFYPWPA